MKTRLASNLTVAATVALALGLFASTPFQLQAQEKGSAKGGGAKLIQLSQSKATPSPAAQIHKPMACQGCADRFVTIKDTDARGAGARALMSGKPATKQAVRHGCVECKNEWVATGHGKAKTVASTHACTKCL